MKKKLLAGAVVAGSAAIALRRLAPHAHNLHEHCREMMQNGCGAHARECCGT